MGTPPPPSPPNTTSLETMAVRGNGNAGMQHSMLQIPATHLPSYYQPSDPSGSSTTPLYTSLLEDVGMPQGTVPARTWIPRNRPSWDENPLSVFPQPQNGNNQWAFQEPFSQGEPSRAASYPMMGSNSHSAAFPTPLRPDSVPLDTTQPLYASPYASPNPPVNLFAPPHHAMDSISPYPQQQQHLMHYDHSYRYAESTQTPYGQAYPPPQPQQQQTWANLSPYPPPPPLHSWSAPAVTSSYPQIKPEVGSPRVDSSSNGIKRRFDSEEDVQSDHDKRFKAGIDFHRIHGIYASILESVHHIQSPKAPCNPPGVQSVPYQTLIEMSATTLEHCQRVSGYRTLKASPKSETTSTTASVIKKEKEKKGREEQVTVCLGCKTTETPEWRKGPLGPRTLCNACGLVFAKLVAKRKKQAAKEAAAAAASSSTETHTT